MSQVSPRPGLTRGPKSVLVTGATGFIGGRLAARLAASGHDVHLLVRPASDTSRIQSLRARIHICPDVCQNSVSPILEAIRPSVVFHLAAAKSTDPINVVIDANLRLGVALAEGLRSIGGGRLIDTGTWWQFDQCGRYQPNGPYAAAKQSFQDMLRFYREREELRATTLVLYDVYGEDDPRKRLMWHLMRASRGESVDFTPGLQRVRLCHVDDVVEAYLAAADGLADAAVPPRVFVGETAVHSVREVADIFMAVLGRPIDLRWGTLPARPGVPEAPCPVDPPLPGWRPSISLELGIRRLLAKAGLIG